MRRKLDHWNWPGMWASHRVHAWQGLRGGGVIHKKSGKKTFRFRTFFLLYTTPYSILTTILKLFHVKTYGSFVFFMILTPWFAVCETHWNIFLSNIIIPFPKSWAKCPPLASSERSSANVRMIQPQWEKWDLLYVCEGCFPPKWDQQFCSLA